MSDYFEYCTQATIDNLEMLRRDIWEQWPEPYEWKVVMERALEAFAINPSDSRVIIAYKNILCDYANRTNDKGEFED